MKSVEARVTAAAKEKKRAVLLEEFKMGIWTREEYREKVGDLDASPAHKKKREVSPAWDIEDDDTSLPTSSSEL